MTAQMIKPYGDTLNDGIVQLAFTLPVEYSEKAKKAAEVYVAHLNFEQINVAHAQKIAENFTYFVVYARALPSIDYALVEAREIPSDTMDFAAINTAIKNRLKRKIVVVGASIGSDAHTVGIDAIMNMKGYHQDYGLERYPEITAINLGAQVTCQELIDSAKAHQADAILISQTVTQKDVHLRNFEEFVALLKRQNLSGRFLLIAGGPRISHDLALARGFDAGFGAHTRPSQVAAYITRTLINKKESHESAGSDPKNTLEPA